MAEEEECHGLLLLKSFPKDNGKQNFEKHLHVSWLHM
jgi:hypothetical protein